MKQFEGKWWLPTNESYQIQGTLTFDKTEGGLLTLSGNFPFPVEFQSLRYKQNFIVLGELNDGRETTLIAHQIRTFEETIGNNFFSRLILDIGFILLGYLFRSIKNILFHRVSVQYSNLSRYFTYFDFERVTQESNTAHPGLKPKEIKIDNLYSIKIIYGDFKKDNLESFFTPAEKVYVEFECINDKTLYEYLDLIYTFRNFLDFVVTDKIMVLSVVGMIRSVSNPLVSNPIEIFWHSWDSEIENKTLKYNIFYTVKDNLVNLINSWFVFKRQFNTVYQYYFAVLDNSASYLSNKFLMIVGAIESYHKIAWENKSVISEEKRSFLRKVKPVIKDAINANTETQNDWNKVNNLMGDWNKPYLADRLLELSDYYWDIISNLSIKIGDKECFAKRVSRYRNDVAHGNVVIEEDDYYDLYYTFRDVHHLLYICILSELNFSNEEIKDILHVRILQEALQSQLQMTLEFLDPNIVTAYNWSTETKLLCKLPKPLNSDPDLFLRIVDSVEDCFEEEAKDLGLSPEEFEKVKFNFLKQFSPQEKDELLYKLSSLNKKIMRDVEKENRAAISLALWSGCMSCARLLSDEGNKGPKIHLRSHIFVIIEKFSADNPLYGAGVEIGPLWKLNKAQQDVSFEDTAPHWHIRKYENLYYDRLSTDPDH